MSVVRCIRDGWARGPLIVVTAFGLLSGCRKDLDEAPPRTTTTSVKEATSSALVAGFQLLPALPDGARLNFVGECNIEFLNSAPIPPRPLPAKRGSQLRISGWAFDPKAKAPADIIYAVLIESGKAPMYGAKAGQRVNRPDTAQTFGLGNATNVGFEVVADTSAVPAGRFSLVLQFERQGTFYLCDNGRKVDISE